MRAAALAAWLLAGSAWAAEDVAFQGVVVKPGDTLWGIANRYLKDPARWDEIVKHNKLPSSDPTVALPGMTLRVPMRLIKEDLRAAKLIYLVNRVLFRRKETADWKSAGENMELFKGDSVRTLDSAKAKVRFLDADLLVLDPNSLVIIKPPSRSYDVELKGGAVFVGRSRVVTATARITPKTRDTQYAARVRDDLSTLVEVFTGLAAVEAEGKSVDVPAGMQSEVKAGRQPSVPRKIPNLPEFEARVAAFKSPELADPRRAGADSTTGALAEELAKAGDAADLQGELSTLRVGMPISGFRVQAARARTFEGIVFDKRFEQEERFDPRVTRLPSGYYWWRIALVDLLGTEGKFSAPRLFSIGMAASGKIDLKESLLVVKPAGDEEVRGQNYRVVGVVKSDKLAVTVNGREVRQDDDGNFSLELKLKPGVNEISISATAPEGHSTTISRRVTYSKF